MEVMRIDSAKIPLLFYLIHQVSVKCVNKNLRLKVVWNVIFKFALKMRNALNPSQKLVETSLVIFGLKLWCRGRGSNPRPSDVPGIAGTIFTL